MDENIRVFILSLQRGDRQDVIEANLARFPHIEVVQAVDGYNPAETRAELNKLDVPYHSLGGPYGHAYRTYGTLANWITKTKMLHR